MRIGNASDLFHFVTSNGLTSAAPELQALVKCLEEYGRLCSCDSEEVRRSKINQCRDIYISFVSKAASYKNILLSKTSDARISFYNGNQFLVTLSR